ncbi:hypothetical protein D3C80_1459150 [compost metagenome]
MEQVYGLPMETQSFLLQPPIEMPQLMKMFIPTSIKLAQLVKNLHRSLLQKMRSVTPNLVLMENTYTALTLIRSPHQERCII